MTRKPTEIESINDALNRLAFFLEGGSVVVNEIERRMDRQSVERATAFTLPQLMARLGELEKQLLT